MTLEELADSAGSPPGTGDLSIHEYAKYGRLKLALENAKGAERKKIVREMARMEAPWSWRRGRKTKPPPPSDTNRDHDSSST